MKNPVNNDGEQTNKQALQAPTPQKIQSIAGDARPQEDSIEQTILDFLSTEHAFVTQLYGLLHNQLACFDIGKTPNLELMQQTLGFMEDYPNLLNHPIKIHLYREVIEKRGDTLTQLEDMLAEKKVINLQRQLAKKHLDSLIKQHSMLKEEQFRIFFKDYLEVFHQHLETEYSLLPASIKSTLDEADQTAFHRKISDIALKPLTSIDATPYPDLMGQLKLDNPMENIDEKAQDLAFQDFVKMSTLIQRLELISEGTVRASAIIKEFSHALFMENFQCYKELLMQTQENKLDYIHKPIRSFKNCYDEYQQSLERIGEVFRDTLGKASKDRDNR